MSDQTQPWSRKSEAEAMGKIFCDEASDSKLGAVVVVVDLMEDGAAQYAISCNLAPDFMAFVLELVIDTVNEGLAAKREPEN